MHLTLDRVCYLWSSFTFINPTQLPLYANLEVETNYIKNLYQLIVMNAMIKEKTSPFATGLGKELKPILHDTITDVATAFVERNYMSTAVNSSTYGTFMCLTV